jgi:hypothetical protein
MPTFYFKKEVYSATSFSVEAESLLEAIKASQSPELPGVVPAPRQESISEMWRDGGGRDLTSQVEVLVETEGVDPYAFNTAIYDNDDGEWISYTVGLSSDYEEQMDVRSDPPRWRHRPYYLGPHLKLRSWIPGRAPRGT